MRAIVTMRGILRMNCRLQMVVHVRVCMWWMYACYSYYEGDPEDELQVADGCACACVYVVDVCVL